MSDFHARVRAFCRRHDLFAAGTTVLVGVSGGIDSLVLLHVLRTLRADFSIELQVATLDHGLRGVESRADAEHVRRVAEAWELPVTVGQASLGETVHHGLEAAARRARYEFLAKTAAAVGAGSVAVGHNRDDQAETVLMHMLRGSGLAGLRGMLPKITRRDGMSVVRPLLEMPRAAIQSYADENGIVWRLDRSNHDTRILRNRLRREILPLLRELNPELDRVLAHTAETAHADYDALIAQLPSLPLRRDRFVALPLSLRRLFVRSLAPEGDLSFEDVERTLEFIARGAVGAQFSLPDGPVIRLTFDEILVDSNSNLSIDAKSQMPFLQAGDNFAIAREGILDLPDGWQLETRRLSPAEVPDQLYRNPLCAVLHIPSPAHLRLRTRQDGDRMVPQGLDGHSQKLSDVLVNMKVPAPWRDSIPILILEDQIGWIVAPTPMGLRSRIAEAFAVGAMSDDDSEIVVLTYRRRPTEPVI